MQIRRRIPEAEQGPEPVKFTLMEQLLLLGLDDSKGHISLLNESISFVLRGLILIELSLMNRIKAEKTRSWRSNWGDQHIKVIDSSRTGDAILDETLRHIESEKHRITTWLDFLSGETWNPLKARFQLKQVRERIAKGLVDKGVLGTSQRKFLVFDMPTHPLNDQEVKSDIIVNLKNALLGIGPPPGFRMIALASAASAGRVLQRSIKDLCSSDREKCRDRLAQWMSDYRTTRDDLPVDCPNIISAAIMSAFTSMDSLLLY